MNIAVCVKQVPDTTSKKQLGPDFRLMRDGDSVMNPFDEYALEQALQLKEAHGGEVTVLTMGQPNSEDMMRKALAMGADRGILVTDPALAGTDWLGTCTVLASALRQQTYDLVLTGMESTDARGGIVPGGLAEMLGMPLVTFVSRLDVHDGTVTMNRQVSGGYIEIEAQLPVVVSVVKGINEPRYPSLKGIMAAKRKEIAKLSMADLDLQTEDLGLPGAHTVVTAATARGEKQAGTVVKPESPEEAARTIADFLQAHKFI